MSTGVREAHKAALLYWQHMTRCRKGFTLIELLVVVAIIGILSSIVLVSLTKSRVSANEATVKADMKSVQIQAEKYYTNAGKYNTATLFYSGSSVTMGCSSGVFTDASVQLAFNAANAANGAGNILCAASGTYFYAGAELTSGWWCVDWQGNSKLESGSLPTASLVNNVCP